MKKLLSFLMVVVMMMSFFSVSALAGKEDNSIVYPITSEPPQLWHNKATDTLSFQLFRHMFVGLMSADEYDQPTLGVAESFEVSEDGLTYTYKIREDAVWWDGEPVTAQDFAYSWLTLIDADVACQYADMAYVLIKNGEAFFKGEVEADEVGIKVIDDRTLEVTLEAPCAYWNNLMSFGVFMPLRQDFIEEFGDAYGTDADKLMGNGPYKVESWQHEAEFVMVKNDLYFDADNFQIDKLVAKVLADANTRLNMFQTGEIDWMEVTPEIKDAVLADGYELSHFGDGATFYLQFNVNEDQVTSNLNVRKAFAYAVDRQAFIDFVIKNDSLPAYYYTTPEIMGIDGVTPFGDQTTRTYEDNNAEKAKEYWDLACEELGMTSEEVASKITMVGDDTTNAINNLAAVQEYLRVNLGIEIVVENMPFKSRLQRTTDRQYSMVFGGWGPDYNDPLTFLEIMTTGNGNNTGDWSNAEFDECIAGARVETDAAARNDLLVRAEQIIIEDLPIVPVYHRVKDYVVEDGLVGMFRTAFQDYNFWNAHWE